MQVKSQVLLLLLATFLVPTTGGGACDFDCFEIGIMGGVSNGTPYCYKFADLTGRLVWSNWGPVGGTPYQVDCPVGDPNYQDAERRSDCDAECPLNEIPQELTDDGIYVGELAFGCYWCSG